MHLSCHLQGDFYIWDLLLRSGSKINYKASLPLLICKSEPLLCPFLGGDDDSLESPSDHLSFHNDTIPKNIWPWMKISLRQTILTVLPQRQGVFLLFLPLGICQLICVDGVGGCNLFPIQTSWESWVDDSPSIPVTMQSIRISKILNLKYWSWLL